MTTEELKREMFYAIAGMKGRIEINHSVKDMLSGVDHFEHALEAYLEELRKDLSFACRSVDLADAKARKALEERDAAIRKLQAFEFANKSAGELLIRAQETIKRQRKFIRTLYTSRKARARRSLAQIRSDKENVPETICDPLEFKLVCLHLLAYPGSPHCPGCGALI